MDKHDFALDYFANCNLGHALDKTCLCNASTFSIRERKEDEKGQTKKGIKDSKNALRLLWMNVVLSFVKLFMGSHCCIKAVAFPKILEKDYADLSQSTLPVVGLASRTAVTWPL